MASFDDPRNILQTLSAPVGDLIAAVGESVAEAQRALDAQTIANFQAVYSEDRQAYEALRSIGYRPTWYQIPEVSAELNIALTVSGQVDRSRVTPEMPARVDDERAPLRVYAAPVDAGYTSKFNYELQAASTVKFRIVPIPPTPAAEQLRVVPDLVGQTLAQARELLAQLDVAFELPDPTPADTDLITAQSPAAGAILGPGQAVELSV